MSRMQWPISSFIIERGVLQFFVDIFVCTIITVGPKHENPARQLLMFWSCNNAGILVSWCWCHYLNVKYNYHEDLVYSMQRVLYVLSLTWTVAEYWNHWTEWARVSSILSWCSPVVILGAISAICACNFSDSFSFAVKLLHFIWTTSEYLFMPLTYSRIKTWISYQRKLVHSVLSK